jgi:hypothetical protein
MSHWQSTQDKVDQLTQMLNEEDSGFYLYGDLRNYIPKHNLVEQVKQNIYNSYAISVTF